MPEYHEYHEPVKYLDENGHVRRIHQALLLMHVSKKFRRAIFRAPFWNDYEFEFDRIFGEARSDSDGQIHRNIIYKHLFAQIDLLQNLEGKSEWIIPGPELLVHILTSLPNFLAKARRIQLCWSTDYGFGIQKLRPCRKLELEIGHHSEYLDLSLFQFLNLKGLVLRFPKLITATCTG